MGISDYKRGTHSDDGFGNLNTMPDLENLNSVLSTYYGFPAASIHCLRNEQATQEGIEREFRQFLIAPAKPGDVVLFYYTGHGHRVTDTSGDEVADSLDEVLVTWVPPNKLRRPEAERRAAMYMLDDVYEKLIGELAQKMRGPDGKVQGTINVIFDSCHSGSATKGLLIQKGREWDPQIDGTMPTPKSGPSAPSEVAAGWLSPAQSQSDGVLFLAACRSNESSYMMPDSVKTGSVMTYHLCEFLTNISRAKPALVTYDDLYRWVASKAAGLNANQNPQVEGDISKGLLGIGPPTGRAPVPRARRVFTGPLRLELGVGSIYGVTVGSHFDVFKGVGDVKDPANRIGEMEIVEVGPLSSVGRVVKQVRVGEPASSFEAAQLVETEHRFEGDPLRVFVAAAPPDKKKALMDAVGTMGFATMTGASATSYDVAVGWDADKGSYYTERSNGARSYLGPSFDVEALKGRLAADWRWRRLAALTLPGPTLVHVDILRADGAPMARTDGGAVVLKPGLTGKVVVTNNADRPMYITLIALAASGAITVFPGPAVSNGQQRINADGESRVLFPTGEVKPPYGIDIFKIIATPEPVDFTGMSYKAEERAAKGNRGPRNPLQGVLFGLVDNQPKDVAIPPIDLSDWYIDQLVLEARPN